MSHAPLRFRQAAQVACKALHLPACYALSQCGSKNGTCPPAACLHPLPLTPWRRSCLQVSHLPRHCHPFYCLEGVDVVDLAIRIHDQIAARRGCCARTGRSYAGLPRTGGARGTAIGTSSAARVQQVTDDGAGAGCGAAAWKGQCMTGYNKRMSGRVATGQPHCHCRTRNGSAPFPPA